MAQTQYTPCDACLLVYPNKCYRCKTPDYYDDWYGGYGSYDSEEEEEESGYVPESPSESCGIENCTMCPGASPEVQASRIAAHAAREAAKQDKQSAVNIPTYASTYIEMNGTASTSNNITPVSPAVTARDANFAYYGGSAAMVLGHVAKEAKLKQEVADGQAKIDDLLEALIELGDHAQEMVDVAKAKLAATSNVRMVRKRDHLAEIINHMDEMVEHCLAALDSNT